MQTHTHTKNKKNTQKTQKQSISSGEYIIYILLYYILYNVYNKMLELWDLENGVMLHCSLKTYINVMSIINVHWHTSFVSFVLHLWSGKPERHFYDLNGMFSRRKMHMWLRILLLCTSLWLTRLPLQGTHGTKGEDKFTTCCQSTLRQWLALS